METDGVGQELLSAALLGRPWMSKGPCAIGVNSPQNIQSSSPRCENAALRETDLQICVALCETRVTAKLKYKRLSAVSATRMQTTKTQLV